MPGCWMLMKSTVWHHLLFVCALRIVALCWPLLLPHGMLWIRNNTVPAHAQDALHSFTVETFPETTICDVCRKLLRYVRLYTCFSINVFIILICWFSVPVCCIGVQECMLWFCESFNVFYKFINCLCNITVVLFSVLHSLHMFMCYLGK